LLKWQEQKKTGIRESNEVHLEAFEESTSHTALQVGIGALL